MIYVSACWAGKSSANRRNDLRQVQHPSRPPGGIHLKNMLKTKSKYVDFGSKSPPPREIPPRKSTFHFFCQRRRVAGAIAKENIKKLQSRNAKQITKQQCKAPCKAKYNAQIQSKIQSQGKMQSKIQSKCKAKTPSEPQSQNTRP